MDLNGKLDRIKVDFNIILKRGYGVQIEKEGRKFLIGSGFNLDEKPKIIVINEKNLKFNRLIVFIISVTIWTVIVFFLLIFQIIFQFIQNNLFGYSC